MRLGRGYVTARLPRWALLGVVFPAAYVTFLGGLCVGMACLPEGFDYGACVISRLCSRVHNPRGFGWATLAMVGLATFLVPLPAFLARELGGCPRLCAWGRGMMWVGLTATAMVGIERGAFPTHWSRLELIHLMMAGVAFIGLWLGLALFAGAAGREGQARVRWRWLYRPPWFLAACVLPIFVIVGMYLPVSIVPGARSRLIVGWPRALVFLRTATFWQWYLTLGLVVSAAAMTLRAARVEPGIATAPAVWRRWFAHEGAPEPGAPVSRGGRRRPRRRPVASWKRDVGS